MHGGPEAASVKGFALYEAGYLRQLLAGKGFFVFEPNYRGSDNLGNAHEMRIFKDPGEGPASDILSGIDALLQNRDIDGGRISIGGHSYGGFLSAWLIGHDHRWVCAVVADGAIDWTTIYNMSSFGNLAWARDSLGGTPSDPAVADLYRTGSPITYVNQVTTPTLILSGTSDQQCPVPESYAFYHPLKDRGVPVRFVALPGAEHSPSRPVQRERYYETIVDWVMSHQGKP
jgi:dipeptidyl aminopeptidase/acylaminoacyl peptidase